MDFEDLKLEMTALYERTLHYKFNREHYDKNMDKLRKRDAALLEKIAAACKGSEKASEELSACIPAYVSEQLSRISSKRRRNMEALDHKMNMVSYYVPLMGELPMEDAGSFAGKMVEKWNSLMPEYKIGYTTTEDIQKGFRTSPCYITTAVCKSLDRPDDCYELTLLRCYRDRYLLESEYGRQLVEEYYNMAPTIVKRIDRREDSREIYREIWEDSLKPCIRLIEEGRMEECREMYSNMVCSLKEEYLYQGGKHGLS